MLYQTGGQIKIPPMSPGSILHRSYGEGSGTPEYCLNKQLRDHVGWESSIGYEPLRDRVDQPDITRYISVLFKGKKMYSLISLFEVEVILEMSKCK